MKHSMTELNSEVLDRFASKVELMQSVHNLQTLIEQNKTEILQNLVER